MALYFFHLCDGGDTLLDTDGRDVADESLIAQIALKEARAIISHEALGGRIRLDQSIEVRDGNDKLVYAIRFRDAVTVS